MFTQQIDRLQITVMPAVTLRPGDKVALDRLTGKLRLAAADDLVWFTLPPKFTISPDGVMTIPEQDVPVGSPQRVVFVERLDPPAD